MKQKRHRIHKLLLAYSGTSSYHRIFLMTPAEILNIQNSIKQKENNLNK